MSKCEDLGNCAFLNKIKFVSPTSVHLYERLYCQDNVEGCARHMVSRALGSHSVPIDLYPHHREIAKGLISRLSG